MAYEFTVNKARGGTPGKPGPPIQANVDGQLVLVYEILETEVGLADEFTIECLPPVGRVTLYESQITGLGTYKPEFGTAPGFVAGTLDHIGETAALGAPRIREAALFAYTSPTGRLVVRSRAGGVPPLTIVHRFTFVEGHEGPSDSTDGTTSVPILLPFTNPDLGEDIHRADGRFSGTPTLIYDGDTAAPPAWTPTNIIGTVDFASAARPFPPSLVSAQVLATTGDIWQLDLGSLFDLSTKHALSMQINVDKDWTALDTIIIYGVNAGVLVGNAVSLADFFDETMTDEWQSVSIDLQFMGLQTSSVTGFRMEVTARNGARALWYFDEFYVQEGGGPIIFAAVAPPATTVEVLAIIAVMVDDIGATVVNGTVPGLVWNQFMGLPELPNGILVQQLVNGVPTPNQALFRSLCDMFEIDFTIESAVSDGAETCLKARLVFDEPLVLLGVPGSATLFSVNDDLRELTRLRVRAVCRLKF